MMTMIEKVASMVKYLPVVNLRNGKEYAYIYNYSLAFCGDEQIVQAEVLSKDYQRLETVDIDNLALAPGIDIFKDCFPQQDRRSFDNETPPAAMLSDNEIIEAMKQRLPVIHNNIKYLYIDRFIISYTNKGKRISSVKLLDYNLNSVSTVPAYAITLAGKTDDKKVEIITASSSSNPAITPTPTVPIAPAASPDDSIPQTTQSVFGICVSCGTPLAAEYFEEKEMDNLRNETGKIRTNINYLYCPYCGKHYSCDDSFATKWHYPNSSISTT